MKSQFMWALSANLILLSSPAIADGCGEWNLQWHSCHESIECEVISGPCGEWAQSINKKYKKIAKDYNICKGAVLDCAVPKKVQQPKAECKASRCVKEGDSNL